MTCRFPLVPLLCALSCPGAPSAARAEPPAETVTLSQPLLELLREEMRGIAAGVQAIAPAVAAGDWDTVHDTAGTIRASYILQRSLTPARAAELERALPAEFKRLDAAFHRRAEHLAGAAAQRDADLVVHHFARLLEACTVCHGRYAAARFPGLAPAAGAGHRH
jgi:cytochrome c556